MAATLTKDMGLALLGNTLPTGAILVVLITILGPISGAHFNPAVSIVFALQGDLPVREAGLYVVAQIAGGIVGTFAAHLMFGLPAGSVDENADGRRAMVRGILGDVRPYRHDHRRTSLRAAAVPWLVGLYITAAYWFTASTSFANPAVAIARSLTNTFSGIRPIDLPGFVVAQLIGAICGLAFATWLLHQPRAPTSA